MFDISHQPLTGKPRENSCEVLIYLLQLFINYFVLSQGCHFMEHSALTQRPLDILWCTRIYEALTGTFRLQNVLSYTSNKLSIMWTTSTYCLQFK